MMIGYILVLANPRSFARSLCRSKGVGKPPLCTTRRLNTRRNFTSQQRGTLFLKAVEAQNADYSSPCDEVQHEAEAEGLAAALFKDHPRTNPFFVMVPRQIFAHLLTRATETDAARVAGNFARRT